MDFIYFDFELFGFSEAERKKRLDAKMRGKANLASENMRKNKKKKWYFENLGKLCLAFDFLAKFGVRLRSRLEILVFCVCVCVWNFWFSAFAFAFGTFGI